MNILIVDDEFASREQIQFILKKEFKSPSNDIRTVSNGYIALKQLESFKPDILITDIMMSKMDGMSLSQEMLRIIPNLKIIFITAYTTEKILKFAIKINIVEFVEKPIIAKALIESVYKARDMFEVNFVENRNKFPEETAIWLTKEKIDYDRMKKNIGYHALNELMNTNFLTVIITFSYKKESLKKVEFEEFGNVIDVFETILSQEDTKAIYSVKHTQYLIVHFYNDFKIKLDQKVSDVLLELIDYFNEKYNFFCCMGKMVYGIDSVKFSYEDAVVVLQRSFVSPKYGILQMERLDNSEIFNDEFDSNELYLQLNANDFSGVISYLNKYYESLMNRCNVIVVQIKNNYITICEMIYIIVNRYGQIKLCGTKREEAFDEIQNAHRLIDIHLMIIKLIQELEKICVEKLNDYNTIEKIKSFVKTNFNNQQLTVSYISLHINLNASYTGWKFKNETGMNLNMYINKIRIKKASQMIKETNKPFEEIAKLCGFTSTNYFYRIFKRDTGYTPKGYRDTK